MSNNKVIAVIFALTGAIAGIALLAYTEDVRRSNDLFGSTGSGYTIHVHPHWAVAAGIASFIVGVVLAVLALALEKKTNAPATNAGTAT